VIPASIPVPIQALPPEILVQVFDRLPNPHHHRDLRAVHNTCTAFRHAVINDGRLQRRYQMDVLALLVSKSAGQATKPNRAVQCIPLLPLLNPAQRGKLVDVVINSSNYGDSVRWTLSSGTDWTADRASHIGRMAQGLAHLDKPQQTRLVQAAIGFAEGQYVAKAIGGFGKELAHLGVALRGEVVNKAISLADTDDRAAAIAALGPGLEHLDRNQQQALLKTALAIAHPDHKAYAVRNLCTGLKYLDAAGQKALFANVISIPPGRLQALAIEHLGASLGSLSPDQRDTLATAVFGLIHHGIPSLCAPSAIRGLAAGLEHLTLPQRDTLVNQSMTRLNRHDKAGAIAALGAGLAHLRPEQQDTLLDAAAGLDTAHGKADAVTGLAVALASLDTARKDRVVDLVLSLPNNDSKARAIAALGARLGHLEQRRHAAVVDAAIRLFKDATISKEMHRAVAAGLGAGLGSLHKDLRSALVDTVTRAPPPKDKQRNVLAAEAIAGLGAGRAHLDEAQYKALIAAATQPQGRSGLAPFGMPGHHLICAFAAEAVRAPAS
jgi:hypothetical protein